MSDKYLFLPSVPTPNGRLHLGHIGGPYLSADICARHLRMLGHEALMMSGTDSFDSYVIERAQKESVTAEQICHHYHHLIVEDLATMNIAVDAFINPLSPEYYSQYMDIHYQLLNDLQQAQATKMLNEYIPWDSESKTFVTGFALKGLCPECNLMVGGYFCESCGSHFKPEDIRQKQSHHEKQVANLFLKVPDDIAVPEQSVRTLYKKFYAQQNGYLRLTTHSTWGLRAFSDDQVLFNYSFIFAYYLLLAGLAFRSDKHAFTRDSDIITISAFGVDNALPFIGSITGITNALHGYKAIDHYLINHFYHLDGSKFSSSKRHAIWVDDLIKNKLNVDIIRLYLASIDVRNHAGNITHEEMMKFHDATLSFIEDRVINNFTCAPIDTAPNHFQHFISMQQAVLHPKNFLPHVAVKILFQCAELRPDTSESFWWLKTLSILAAPFMPVISQQVWNALGYEDSPVYADILSLPTRQKTEIRRLYGFARGRDRAFQSEPRRAVVAAQ